MEVTVDNASKKLSLTCSLLTLGVAIFGLGGCIDRPLGVIEPIGQSQIEEVLNQNGVTKLDMLFVVDNSGSMHEEQEELGRRVEQMIRELVHPSNADDPDGPSPVTDLHLAVISTDIGSGGYRLGTCDNPSLNDMGGDRGLMQTGVGAACSAESFAPYATFDAESNATPIWEQFACVANLGTGGCGIEQPLEAALMALSPQSDPGMPNSGFLRPDSLLAVIFVTDEDDCSAQNATIFDSDNGALGPAAEMNQRCVRHADLLQPVDRYIDGFRALRDDPDTQLVVATISGVPADWEGSLDDLRGMVIEDSSEEGGLRPSCRSTHGAAVPPVRLAQFTQAFGENGLMESICNDDWTASIQAIGRKIGEMLPSQCIARELPVPVTPQQCRVVESLSDDRPCPGETSDQTRLRSSGWQLDLGVTDGRRECQLLPADYDGDGRSDSDLDGWFYRLGSEDSSCPGEIAFTPSAVPQPGSRTSIECLTSLCSARQTCEMELGESCDPQSPSCAPGEVCETDGRRYRCTPSIESFCPGASAETLSSPIVTAGCCHTGFHCEDDIAGQPQCVPNRTTACEL
jgi:hypothetical protein